MVISEKVDELRIYELKYQLLRAMKAHKYDRCDKLLQKLQAIAQLQDVDMETYKALVSILKGQTGPGLSKLRHLRVNNPVINRVISTGTEKVDVLTTTISEFIEVELQRILKIAMALANQHRKCC